MDTAEDRTDEMYIIEVEVSPAIMIHYNRIWAFVEKINIKGGRFLITIQNYIKVQSLQEAYELNQKRGCRILGGMMWMRLSSANVNTVIDLSGLGLQAIEETANEFSIGCMCTLRALEMHPGLDEYFDGAVKKSVKSIIGVQFRNGATVGGSVFGRFGFSDVLTLFLALDAYVELYRRGMVRLADFMKMERDNDILVRIVLRKDGRRAAYLAERNAQTDFPILTCAAAVKEEKAYIAVGARPMKAECIVIDLWEGLDDTSLRKVAAAAADRFTYGSNMRGSSEYRRHLAEIDIYRNLKALQCGQERI